MSGAGRADRAESKDEAPGPADEPGAAVSADETASEDTTPEGTAPQDTAPQDTAPEGKAPGGKAQSTAETGSGGGRKAVRRPRRKRSFWREFPILVVVALLLAVV